MEDETIDAGESDVHRDEFAYELRIPEERVAVLVGTGGKVKADIENHTDSKLEISKDGGVLITGGDALSLFVAKEIARAIGRGFNPHTAMLLLKPDYILEVIDLKEVAGKNKNTLERLKGRVIGTGGKAREEIERLTGTSISVYGKTVAVIGEVEQASIAREAVAMLLSGSMHKTVYQFLERKRREMALRR